MDKTNKPIDLTEFKLAKKNITKENGSTNMQIAKSALDCLQTIRDGVIEADASVFNLFACNIRGFLMDYDEEKVKILNLTGGADYLTKNNAGDKLDLIIEMVIEYSNLLNDNVTKCLDLEEVYRIKFKEL